MSSVLDFLADFVKRFELPLATESGQARLACEQLLHGGLLEVSLLGDEPIQRAQKRIHIAQSRCYGAPLGRRWECNWQASHFVNAKCSLGSAVQFLIDVLLDYAGSQPSHYIVWFYFWLYENYVCTQCVAERCQRKKFGRSNRSDLSEDDIARADLEPCLLFVHGLLDNSSTAIPAKH